MVLSIITINRNNATGLGKTIRSVISQSVRNLEYIVIDGASTDGSVDVIKQFAPKFEGRLNWVSELDSGIYNAMNKGIRMATGDYIQILNSGDTLASNEVTERMIDALEKEGYPDILYGNMIKVWPDGRKFKDTCGGKEGLSMLDFYRGTLNHDCAYIRRSLFDKFGLYDENLKICSDWEWYLKAIPLGGVKPVYVDIDVTQFDMTGISESGEESKKIIKAERRQILEELVPEAILKDYDNYSFDIEQMSRLHRYPHIYKFVWFIERCLFKIEKWKRKRCFYR